MRLLGQFRKLHRETRGELMLEFAVSVLIAFTVFLWLMEFGFTMYDEHVIRGVAEAGVDYAATLGPNSTLQSGPWSSSDSNGKLIIVPYVTSLLEKTSLKPREDFTDGTLKIQPCWSSIPTDGTPPVCQPGPGATTNVGESNLSTSQNAMVMVTVQWTYHPYTLLPGIRPTLTYSAISPMLN